MTVTQVSIYEMYDVCSYIDIMQSHHVKPISWEATSSSPSLTGTEKTRERNVTLKEMHLIFLNNSNKKSHAHDSVATGLDSVQLYHKNRPVHRHDALHKMIYCLQKAQRLNEKCQLMSNK